MINAHDISTTQYFRAVACLVASFDEVEQGSLQLARLTKTAYVLKANSSPFAAADIAAKIALERSPDAAPLNVDYVNGVLYVYQGTTPREVRWEGVEYSYYVNTVVAKALRTAIANA